MNKNLYILLVLSLLPFSLMSQSDKSYIPEFNYDSIILNSEIPVIMGQEVIVTPGKKYRSRREQRRYSKLIRNFKKVYPYAKLINKTMDDLEKDIEDIPTDRLKQQYIRHREKQLRKQYGKEIKKLTISQGLLLIKLIDRETGDTSYQILKELKGGLLAGTFQGLARLFGHDLTQLEKIGL